ncbi:3-keto-disaccharide hydrolase [Namhaeicola litoreus]|uniref:DUF1080 domain-containing protein n=1 Tax=Namhaeicola litoreus TaxID=1052145 RepID=A0ABW3Y3Q8_9FLAO
MSFRRITLVILILFFTISHYAQKASPLEGRWDLVVDKDNKELPSWLEIRHSGTKTFVGRFVYAFGSARPVAEVKISGNKFSFSIPPQWEEGDRNMDFEGELIGDQIKGIMIYTDGKPYPFVGKRQSVFSSPEKIVWSKSEALFNGKNIEGWHLDGDKNKWTVNDGILSNAGGGSNLITDDKFGNFKLKAEFRYPNGSNSGIYLRGRYEVQITDNKGMEPSDIYFGGVYGFLEPNQMAAKNASDWQTYEITLVGNRVTIIANGKSIITDQTIPGITGGAIDSQEGQPGPIMLQGDHGAVEFKSIEIIPIQ